MTIVDCGLQNKCQKIIPPRIFNLHSAIYNLQFTSNLWLLVFRSLVCLEKAINNGYCPED